MSPQIIYAYPSISELDRTRSILLSRNTVLSFIANGSSVVFFVLSDRGFLSPSYIRPRRHSPDRLI